VSLPVTGPGFSNCKVESGGTTNKVSFPLPLPPVFGGGVGDGQAEKINPADKRNATNKDFIVLFTIICLF
jgi:hypothetical protein